MPSTYKSIYLFYITFSIVYYSSKGLQLQSLPSVTSQAIGRPWIGWRRRGRRSDYKEILALGWSSSIKSKQSDIERNRHPNRSSARRRHSGPSVFLHLRRLRQMLLGYLLSFNSFSILISFSLIVQKDRIWIKYSIADRWRTCWIGVEMIWNEMRLASMACILCTGLHC